MTLIALSEKFLFSIAAILFTVGFLFNYFQIKSKGTYSHTLTYLFLLFGFVLQSIALYLRALVIHACPLGNTFEILQFILWSLILLFLLIRPVIRINALGLFIIFIASLVSAISLLIPSLDNPYVYTLEANNPFIELHASLAIFSYAIYMLLAIVSSMLLIQQWGLKKQRFQGLFSHLPAVQKLDSIANVLVWIASLTLFIGILFGSFYWNEHPETVPLFKLLLTTLILILYCVVGVLKYFNKITPQKQAIAYIFLFILAILSLGAVQAENPQEPNQAEILESPMIK
ncbi:MAG: Uncharacterised protein [Puniceicoccaceae bacterium MED-G32]|jgi:ABC-type uncharacterized transport system permease subunit|nr:MAG: Uncharacterised protein [Puniceicoccaceae bacterium MED-G32]|tara:strand:- start:6392 stop:7252 length:861 start_codon:yes stop_codon:yes gene_type:complete